MRRGETKNSGIICKGFDLADLNNADMKLSPTPTLIKPEMD